MLITRCRASGLLSTLKAKRKAPMNPSSRTNRRGSSKHWSPPFPHDPKSSAFEQLQPFRGDKRLNADVDVQRQRTLDLMTDLAAGVIGHYAKLVDAVPAAAPEKPAHLTENPHLDLGGLHRKHGFAIRD